MNPRFPAAALSGSGRIPPGCIRLHRTLLEGLLPSWLHRRAVSGRVGEALFQPDHECLENRGRFNVLYYEEIEEGTPGLDELGLSLLEVQGEGVTYAFGLHEANSSDVSSHDCLALALARQQECPLLTGDQNLRTLAKQENVEVMGTIWLLKQMVIEGVLSQSEACAALDVMKDNGSRPRKWCKSGEMRRPP